MKIFLKVFLGFVVLLIFGVAIFFLTFDLNSYKGIIVEAASKAIGRPVTIDSLEMKLSLIPTIKIKGVRIENPNDFQSEKAFATIDAVEATLAVAPLFSRKLEVRDFSLGTVMLNLAENNGRNNWTFVSDSSEKKKTEPVVSRKDDTTDEWLSQMRIDSVSAKSLVLSVSRNGVSRSFSIVDISVKQLKVFSLTLVYNGKNIKISGTVNDILDLIKQKPDYLFNLEITAFDATAKISGSIGDTNSFKNILLNVNLSGMDLRQTLSQINIRNSLIPKQRFDVSTVLQGDASKIKIGATTLTLGENKLKLDFLGDVSDITEAFKIALTGSLTLTDSKLGSSYGLKPFSSRFDLKMVDKLITINNFSFLANRSDAQIKGQISLKTSKPQIDLTIASEYFDVKDVLSDKDQDKSVKIVAKKSSEDSLIQDKPIDLSKLNTLDANISFNLPHMAVSDELSGYIGVIGQLTLKNGILNITPLRMTLLDGDVRGKLYLNAMQQLAPLTVQLTGTNLDLNKLKQLKTIVRDATMDFSIDLSSKGNSVKTFMAGLNGQIVLEVPQGTIVNKWFNTLPANMGIFKSKISSVSFSTSDQESRIICGAVNLRVKNGEIKSDNNVAIETSTANFLVGGDVNLKTEEMNLTMIPSLNEVKESVNKVLSAAQFVKITGTFSKPRAALNEKEVITSAAKIGMEKLIEKQLEKQGIKLENKTTEESVPYLLCQKVLGRKTIGQIQEEQQERSYPIQLIQEEKEEPKPEILSPQEEFKKQLMDSLSEVLQ